MRYTGIAGHSKGSTRKIETCHYCSALKPDVPVIYGTVNAPLLGADRYESSRESPHTADLERSTAALKIATVINPPPVLLG